MNRWEKSKAQDWLTNQPWLCGCNFLPSTAVNSTEMWQAESFDPATIERELGLAAGAGMNTCRVFLPYLVWEANPDAFERRFEDFLALAEAQGICVMPVLFDDCAFAGKQPYLGPQDAPVPGIHNSGWTPSPGHERSLDPAAQPALERYVTSLIGRFGSDRRVIAWDLYNEPGNAGMEEQSLPLLERVFSWARAAEPTQPLTIAPWCDIPARLEAFCLAASDVISFHHYGTLDDLQALVARLSTGEENEGRPLICTEWMGRTLESYVGTHLPYFAETKIGCYSWGLVCGKTQTQFPWGSEEDAPEPELWFHDLFYPDGRAYRPEEIDCYRNCRQRATGLHG